MRNNWNWDERLGVTFFGDFWRMARNKRKLILIRTVTLFIITIHGPAPKNPKNYIIIDIYCEKLFWTKKLLFSHQVAIKHLLLTTTLAGCLSEDLFVLICHILIVFWIFDPTRSWIMLIKSIIVQLCYFYWKKKKFLTFRNL